MLSFLAPTIYVQLSPGRLTVRNARTGESISEVPEIAITREPKAKVVAREADAVIVGSGVNTREFVRTPDLMAQLKLDPSRQVIGAQCSGALVLAKLGLLGGLPACTDSITKPWVVEAGVKVLDQPFVAHGNVATAGGCLSSHYLAAWIIARLAGWKAAESVVRYVAPVGQKDEYVARARAAIGQYLPVPA